MRDIYYYIEEGVRKIYNAIPFTISYNDIELDFEVGAHDWFIVGDCATDLIIDNKKMWGLENLSDDELEEVVLDFKIILREDWCRIIDILLDDYFVTDPWDDEETVDYTFFKGEYTLRYINDKWIEYLKQEGAYIPS